MREGDITFFRRKFLNHSTGEIHLEIFVVSETFCYGKKNMKTTGVNAKFRQTIFVSIYRQSALGTLRCFTNILVARILHGWERGISRFSVDFFPKNFIGNTSSFQKISCSEIFLWMRGGISCFPVEKKTFNHSTGKFYWERFVVWENFWYLKKWMDKTGGISKFCGTLVSCYRKDFWELFGISKNFWQQEVYMDERRGYHVFQSKSFESQYQRISLGNLRGFRSFLEWEDIYEEDGGNANFRQILFVSFYRESALGTIRCFTKLLVARILHKWEKGISRFSVANFLYQSFESFLWELFVVSEKFWKRKYLGMRRGYHVFQSILFVSEYQKISLGALQCFRKIPVAKSLNGCEGGYHVFRSILFDSWYRKLSLGTFQCFKKYVAAKSLYGWEKGISRFSVNFSCLILAKNFIVNNSLFQRNFW